MERLLQLFDTVVIGAGIAGSSLAYFLLKRGVKTAVIEKNGVASGASGAAGAFLSPMMGKGALVEFTNIALKFSLDLYDRIAPDLLVKNGAERFPKSGETYLSLLDDLAFIDLPYAKEEKSVFFYDAGVIQAEGICRRLLKSCTLFERLEASRPLYKNGVWQIGDCKAKILAVAIGAYNAIVPDWFTLMRGVWGERLLLRSDMEIPHNLMADIAISATFSDRTFALGATHRRAKSEWEIDGNAKNELLGKAKALKSDITNAEVLDIKGSMRPASSDYMPIVGALPDAAKTFENFPRIVHGEKVEEYIYHPDLYLFTGHGSRGFVTAPYTANMLAEAIAGEKKTTVLSPDRFLERTFRRKPYDWIVRNVNVEESFGRDD
jgi:tRNA 5-methylaminomethyl-2-thiouridine biosynthesis bifunctional protein